MIGSLHTLIRRRDGIIMSVDVVFVRANEMGEFLDWINKQTVLSKFDHTIAAFGVETYPSSLNDWKLIKH